MTSVCERDLPRWIRDLLGCPPAEGTGLHGWLYRAACALKPWRSAEDAQQLLLAATQGQAKRDLRREIADAVKNARNDWQPGGQPQRAAPPISQRGGWPQRDMALIENVARDGAGLADLWEASPIRCEFAPDGIDFLEPCSKAGKASVPCEDVIDLLFPGAPLLCCAQKHPSDAATLPREQWRGKLARQSLIVPSPMTARQGTNQSGRTGPRTLANTAPRRWLVVELDFKASNADGTPRPEAQLLRERTAQDLCAAILLRLAGFGPLALVVSSGGKSLHGWFKCDGVGDEDLRPFFAEAVRLGADPATWVRCQFVRMPGGTRENGNEQSILYFNPKSIS